VPISGVVECMAHTKSLVHKRRETSHFFTSHLREFRIIFACDGGTLTGAASLCLICDRFPQMIGLFAAFTRRAAMNYASIAHQLRESILRFKTLSS